MKQDAYIKYLITSSPNKNSGYWEKFLNFMKIIDFHGFTKIELSQKIDNIIGLVRLNNKSEVYTFITGEGPLKEYLKNYLKEMYDLDYTEIHNSAGAIQVVIE